MTQSVKRALSPGTWEWGRQEAAVLIVVLALAAVVRLLPARAGLPYLHDWDEPLIAATALDMMKTGDLNPHFFHYGSLTIYAQLGVDVLHYFYLLRQQPIPFPVVPGRFEHEEIDLGAIETYFDTGWLWQVSHPSFVLWNRGFNALLGTATVLLAFLLARALAGGTAALLAAALLAVAGFHVERSAIVNPGVAMTLAALAAVYGAVAFVERPRPRVLVAALACCGLAASAKYNGVYCLIAPLAALFVVRRSRRVPRWLWGAVPVVPALAFLLTTPYAVLDLPAFLSQAGFELYHYAARGHGAVSVEPGWQHLVLQVRRVGEHFGVVPALFAVAGTALLLRRRRGFVAVVFPLCYFLYMATTRAAFHRNLLPVYPLLAVAAAVFLIDLLDRLQDPVGRRPRLRRTAALLLALAVAGWLGYRTFAATSSGWESWTGRETRSQAIDAVRKLAAELAPRGDVRVGLAAELRIHPLDLARLDVPHVVAPHLELVCDAARFDVLVTGAQYVGLWDVRPEAKRRAWRLNQAVLEVERREIGGPVDGFNVTRLDALSRNPVVVIYLPRRQVENLPEVCTE